MTRPRMYTSSDALKEPVNRTSSTAAVTSIGGLKVVPLPMTA
eukprot:CAMPEP_0171663668 /NCGR_PEP_ID=MMETSP0990-20121206/46316_1 /TAXON_ID=483369 /ORGANISM="non described non described, Strain CCMP2098" /LENGTH=41 /DNA_ID= /DNA_START= /DNA_END= /DNA_ORIENTATION=